MDYKYIEQLLERYWQAETTLEEEEILHSFFAQREIPSELAQYKPLFAYGHEQKKCVLDEDFENRVLALTEEKPRLRVVSMKERLSPLFRAAAVVAIVITLGSAMQVPFQQRDAEAAPENVASTPSEVQAPSVALTDSVAVDSMRVN